MKKIICLVLTLAMLASLSVGLFSCTPDDGGNEGGNNDNNTDSKINYTVTVTNTDGTPIKGAVVTFSPKGAMAVPFPTDAEGKASFKTDKELTVAVTSVPAGYEYDKLGQAQSFDKNGKLSVVISKIQVDSYLVIKVVDTEGNPLSDVKVQMCDEAGSCRRPIFTGSDGTASYAFEEGSFHAQLTELPEGYTVDDVTKYYDFVDGVATITLTKLAD